MKNEIIISYIKNNVEQKIKYVINDKTKIKDLLKYLYYEIEKNSFVSNKFEFVELLGCFTFQNKHIQKANLNYQAINFFKNFEYDLKNIRIVFDSAYGIGACCQFKEIAKIKINGYEPKHINKPHVHICKIGKKDNGISFSLVTFSPFDECKKDWNKLYSTDQKKEIILFLKTNKDKLVDFYNRCTKGEYITDDFILMYNGKKYEFFKYRFF